MAGIVSYSHTTAAASATRRASYSFLSSSSSCTNLALHPVFRNAGKSHCPCRITVSCAVKVEDVVEATRPIRPLPRRGLLVTALFPFLVDGCAFGGVSSMGAFSDTILAEGEEEKLKKMRNELVKVITKPKSAGVLRLVFHDAGTFNKVTNTGGMNGSVLFELERPENTGLQRPVKVLDKAKTCLEPALSVSWADLIAVAGAEAVAICGGPKIVVKLGRLDSLLPDPEGEIPEETLGAVELKEKFQNKGFSTQEMIALSGAHTLGSKGFGDPVVFDNSYFKILLQKPWIKTGSEMSTMIGLPSDRALTNDVECVRWLKVYADDEDRFFRDFSSAYVKLVNMGAQWAL